MGGSNKYTDYTGNKALPRSHPAENGLWAMAGNVHPRRPAYQKASLFVEVQK